MSQIKKWGLKKNISAKEMTLLVQRQQRRQEKEDKTTTFSLRGGAVNPDKIARWERRHAMEGSAKLDQSRTQGATTPSDIAYLKAPLPEPSTPGQDVSDPTAFEKEHMIISFSEQPPPPDQTGSPNRVEGLESSSTGSATCNECSKTFPSTIKLT